jgi:hypothetical protein
MSRWNDAIEAAKAASAPTTPATRPTVEIRQEPPSATEQRPRMIDRKDGPARLEYVFVEGKIRGGKRSNQWGRPRNNASREGWVGACLPVETRQRLKRLQVQHDLHEWQVLVEAIDLFAKTYGDGS